MGSKMSVIWKYKKLQNGPGTWKKNYLLIPKYYPWWRAKGYLEYLYWFVFFLTEAIDVLFVVEFFKSVGKVF